MSKPSSLPCSSHHPFWQDLLLVSAIILICQVFIYFFHFDVFVTSDSAWTAIAEMKLLKKGLHAILNPNLSHGMTYLFSYYAFYYALLKTPFLSGLELIHRLNLLNGFVFSANIALLYLFLRLLSLNRILSFFLSLLYFFIPKVFLLSLYVNPNALSLFFFLAANIFWVSHLKGQKAALLLTPVFCLLSVLIRIETILFYVSFISLAIALQKPVKRSLIFCGAIILFSGGGAWLIQKAMYASSSHALPAENYRTISSAVLFNPLSFFRDAGCIAAALGAGLTAITFFVVFRFYQKNKFRALFSFFLWFGIPVLVSLIAAAGRDLTRFLIPAFLSVIVLLGFFVKTASKGDPKLQCFSLVLIYAIHFLGMPISYEAVKKIYPLKRLYRPDERIVTEGVPLGNIFEDSYYLKLEKQREWSEAERVIDKHKKVIVLSNNVYRIPFHYFLYKKGGGTVTARWNKTYYEKTKQGGKEFLFLDVLPAYDRETVFALLENKKFLDFEIYFPPYIPERIPELYEEIKEFCEIREGKIIAQN